MSEARELPDFTFNEGCVPGLVGGVARRFCAPARIDSHTCLSPPLSFGKLPPDMIADFFVGLEGGPSQGLMDAMRMRKPEVIRDVGTMMLQYRPSDAIPKCCSDHRVLAQFLKLRLEQVGPRIQGWFNVSVTPRGDVDWCKQPLFRLKWSTARLLKQVVHITGDIAEVPAHVVITSDFVFEHPHSDADAALVLPPARQLVRELFAVDKGPNRFMIGKRDKMIVSLAKRAMHLVAHDGASVGVASSPPPSSRVRHRGSVAPMAAAAYVCMGSAEMALAP